jgi:lipoprotein-anchoring transpeptidase ErfK/SrfK
MFWFRKYCALFFLAIFLVCHPLRVCAETAVTTPLVIDSDADGLPDQDELLKYHSSPQVADTDGDGIGDGTEVQNGYSPLVPAKKLSEVDTDGDGLMDSVELAFGTDLANKDTDADGFLDGTEVFFGYDPRTAEPKRLEKRIRIHTVSQRLEYELDGIVIGSYIVSTGKKSTPTPIGTFTVTKKAPRAWSRSAQLWMPWWMNFTGTRAPSGMYAIHELPEWPGGKKEGEKHLGTPVSHGCVRLGIGSAKDMYDWTPIGTPVTIQKD